jgi:adenosylcobinamide kinase/adenosylcobinamide-phosphate guanylyltransferase
MPATIYLVTGGCRSGKSSYAQTLCEKLASNPIYLATSASEGEYVDESYRERIKRHQAARDEKWTTIEESLHPSKHLTEMEGRVVLVDCLSLWLTNFMLECKVFSVNGDEDQESDSKSERTAAAEEAFTAIKQEFDKLANQWNTTFVFVTNEVGSGTHGSDGISRMFVDYQGFFNQYVASKAFRVVHMIAGCPKVIKEDRGSHRQTCSLIPTSPADADDAFLLDKYLSSRNIKMDDKGYFIMKIEDKRIVASFYSCIVNEKGEVCDLNGVKIPCCGTKNTREPMKEWSARTAKELCAEIFEVWDDAPKIFSLGHAAYIGREAMKAEKSLYENGFYQQD